VRWIVPKRGVVDLVVFRTDVLEGLGRIAGTDSVRGVFADSGAV
jgi:hypothetical protein